STLVERGLDKDLLLSLTFLPEELIQNGKELRNFMKNLREDLSPSVRSYKQKIRMNPSIPLKGSTGEDEEEPASREWEKQWSEQFGLEKNTPQISLQYIWTWIFVPLAQTIFPYAKHRKLDRWEDRVVSSKPFAPDDAFK